MATNDGDFRYPPLTGEFDIPARRRIPHPPRLDPLRINPPSRPSTPGGGPQPSYSQRPPPMPRKYPAYPALDDPFARAASPQPPRNEDRAMRHPVYQRAPTFPLTPHERSPKPYPRAKTPDRPSHRNLSPIQPPLRTSRSTSRLNGRPPKAHRSHDRQLNDQYALALPRSHPYGSPDSQEDDTLRSSVNSAMTSRSSIEQASGTERSSVLTKSSSITDLSPDTPDAPYNDKDGGMSVEDAISMYLDGFSDVTEEPTSPDFRDDGKLRPLSPPRPPTALTLDDGHTSDEHSPDMDPVKDLPPVPPLTSLNPPDQNQLDGPFLGEAESGVTVMTDPLEQTPSNPGLGIAYQETKIRVRGEVPPPLLLDTESRDRYGFRKANHHVTLQQYETWSAGYGDFLANRRVKWSELLREHDLPTSDPTVFPAKSSRVKRFVRKGIPSEFRGAAWFWYAGGYEHLNRNPGLYDRLVHQAMESPSNDDKEHIERDLHRTFPDNCHFKPDNADELCRTGASSGSSPPKQGSVTVETDMIQSLRRVLYAFALHSPQVGYTQSLNFITGMLLLFLPEEKAFWMLHIITSVYLPGTHEISLEGANIDLWILMVLLRDSMPHVYNKITGTGTRAKTPPLTVHSRLPDITLGLTNWLMSVFIGTLPLETTLRVWDVFFYEGSKTFFRVSLAIFKACERDILAVSDPMEVFQVIQTVPKKLLDANTLLDDCFVRRHRVGQGRIEELRLSRRTAVRQDKLRRSIAMSKGQLQAATDEWTTPRSRTPIPGIERSLADSWRHMKHHAFR